MFSFIYSPDRLPPSYNSWIKSASGTDIRLIQTLRHMREGKLTYGVKSEYNYPLIQLCEEFKWPMEWADNTKTIPVPCSMVHMKVGQSCEYHAILRLIKSSFWALSTYIPLNMILAMQNPSVNAIKRALRSSVRSSLFLGSFVSLFYYGLCLFRTRLGPLIYGDSVDKRIETDSGLCTASGSMLCGWSILIESAKRRKELSLFVAPRAMATLFPRYLPPNQQWKEALAFSLSISVLFTAVAEKPNRVRGFLGKVLQKVLVN